MKRIYLALVLLFSTQAHASFTLTKPHCDAIGTQAAEVIRLKKAGYSRDDTMRTVAINAVKGAPQQKVNLDVYPYVVGIVAFLYSEGVVDGGQKLVDFSVQICPKSVGHVWQ